MPAEVSAAAVPAASSDAPLAAVQAAPAQARAAAAAVSAPAAAAPAPGAALTVDSGDEKAAIETRTAPQGFGSRVLRAIRAFRPSASIEAAADSPAETTSSPSRASARSLAPSAEQRYPVRPAQPARPSSPISRPRFAMGMAASVLAFIGSMVAVVQPAPAQAPIAPTALVAPLLMTALPGAEAGEADYYQSNELRDMNALVNAWKADVHVYVLGRLPSDVRESDLRALEAQLKGTHWYAVIAQNMNSAEYKDVHGASHTGQQGLDYAIGRGIGHLSAFEALKHPKSGESDGAVVGIYLENRKLFLRTSAAHDSRGMSGETQFAGNLDQWAKNAMRNQGPRGIPDAVRATAENIDARLNQQIEREVADSQSSVARASAKLADLQRRAPAFQSAHPGQKAALAGVDLPALAARLASAEASLKAGKLQEAAAAAGAVETAAGSALSAIDAYEGNFTAATAALGLAETRLADLAAKSAAFNKAYPGLTGDLARVDLPGFAAQLAAAKGELEADPARAASLAKTLEGRVTQLTEAIARYPAAGGQLQLAEKRLAYLQGLERADSARMELVEAKQALADASKAYAAGDSSYAASQERATGSLDAAERQISDADAAARAAAEAAAQAAMLRRFFFWLFAVLATGGTGLALLLMNRSVQGAKAKARALLDQWDAALNAKIEAVQGVAASGKTADEALGLEGNYGGYIAPRLETATGETATIVKQAHAANGWIHITLAMAQSRLEKFRELMAPKAWVSGRWWYNLVRPGNFDRALKFESEQMAFDPLDQDLMAELFGAKGRTWEDKLLGKAGDYDKLTGSFEQIVDQYNANAETVLNAIKTIRDSVQGLGPKLEAAEGSIAAAAARKAAVQTGELFLMPSLFDAALPAATAAVAEARKAAQTDPVGAYKTADKKAARIADEAGRLADLVTASRAGVLAQVDKSAKALQALQFETSWIDQELTRLSGEAEKAAAAMADGSVAAKIAALEGAFKALAEKAATALTLAQEHGRVQQRIGQAQGEIAEARKEISAKTGVPEEDLLKENGWKVDNKLYHAGKRLEEAKGFLGLGDLDSASAKVVDAQQFGQQVSEILEISLASARGYDQAVAALGQTDARLSGAIPKHEGILQAIVEGYAASVLKLAAGDAAHPDADGTVKNNIDEAQDHLKQARDKSAEAAEAFKAGRVVETADLLNQVKGHQQLVAHRLDEIAEKQARLEKTEAANKALLQELRGKVDAYGKDLKAKAWVMQPTLDSLDAADGDLEKAGKLVSKEKGDPFAADEALKAVQTQLQRVYEVTAKNDKDIYDQAQSSVKAAQKAVDALNALVTKATTDELPDSKELTDDARAAQKLTRDLGKAAQAATVAHSDWTALDTEADRITAEATKLTTAVKGEMEKAKDAAAAIAGAAKMVRSASNWSGNYGIRVTGSPGDRALDEARALLLQGLYIDALQRAERAEKAARKAIEEAEAAVDAERQRLERIAAEERRKREEEEEERRRQARARQRSSSDDSSSSWGSSSGGGGGSWGSFGSSGGGSSDFGGFSSSGGGSSGW
ncbi:MAG TPA: hypothetical protein VNI01_06590 [Elusimicrobiota bacterium]|nr:hypothetical protein [Elusimicrobiota bacterium]